jgi:hypothetical protein
MAQIHALVIAPSVYYSINILTQLMTKKGKALGTRLTNDVTRCAESAIYILHIFAYNFGTNLASQGLLLPHGATAKTLVPSGHA